MVHGLKRRASLIGNAKRIDHLYQDSHEDHPDMVLHYGDMTDATNLIRLRQETQPDEMYNLAAQSHVQVSFETPEYTANADALGTLRLLEAIRVLRLAKKRGFTKPPRPNSSVRSRASRRRRLLRSIRARLMRWRSFTPTGSP